MGRLHARFADRQERERSPSESLEFLQYLLHVVVGFLQRILVLRADTDSVPLRVVVGRHERELEFGCGRGLPCDGGRRFVRLR